MRFTPLIFLVGNKADNQAHAQVDINKAAAFAKKVKSKLYETSAKEGTGIDMLFRDVAEKLYAHKMSEQEDEYNIVSMPATHTLVGRSQ